MDINSIKSIKPGNQLPKKLLAIFVSVAVIIGSFIYLNSVNDSAKDTVDIVVVKASGGIPANTLITKDNIGKYSIIRKEFNDDMITYDKVDSILNKYSLYYLRNGAPIYYDQLTDEKPRDTEWLYDLEENYEVLTIKYDYLECGGSILRPGDLVRVRVTYTEEIPSSDGMMYGGSKKVKKTEILFDSIRVKDLINSSGRSIYEVLKEVFKLSEKDRREVMKSRDFMQSIKAESLLLAATEEQVNKFAKFKSQQDAVFTFTILSRNGNDEVFDQLPVVEKEVESWITESEEKD
ncbi:SAF domain-containing protein [Acetivibrio thermocellus]|uniref:SAF domain-containing protein n=1 Tax=Acetivibrio thermocellus TaxID=1515 RepID=UPI0010A61D7D|nr:SAF domain-containing protein [Acetivibrio thermocellus]THJ78174.1 flagellar biosynthesis protein FlgA [Acetivibrio thermocellus]